jgi:hypothetical protein
MARSPATGDGSHTEATTLIFPKKSAWDELIEAKVTAKSRAGKANGVFSKTVSRLVEEEHMDRRAARIIVALDLIEDDSDLHVTVHHVIDGMKKRGILKRAMAQEEMFDEHKIDDEFDSGAEGDAPKAGKRRGRPPGSGKKASEPDMTNVTSIGEAARSVAEAAGDAA